MYIFYKFKKILFVLLTVFVFSSFNLLSADGFKAQTKALSDLVHSYIDKTFESSRRDINIADLSEKLKQKAVSVGLDLCFNAEKLNSKNYLFNGVNRVTNRKICKIMISDFVVNSRSSSCSISVELDPNSDGCIKNVQDGSLCINKPLEAVFVKNKDNVYIADANSFNCSNKNVYKVIQQPSLCQDCSGPCGYYAINNILMAYNGTISVESLLNRNIFEPFYSMLIGFNGGKTESVGNDDISRIINNNLRELCNRNVFISIEKINNLNCLSEETIMTFGASNYAKDRIKDFQKNGTTQYLIVGTGDKKSDQFFPINGLELNWDNAFDRLYCVVNHWIVLKIEWSNPGMPGNCPVILSVFDSSGPKDNRFARLIHWYYHVFTSN